MVTERKSSVVFIAVLDSDQAGWTTVWDHDCTRTVLDVLAHGSGVGAPRSRLRRNRAVGANSDLGTLGNHAVSLGKRRNREQKKKCKWVFHGFPQRTYSEDVPGCLMSCPHEVPGSL